MKSIIKQLCINRFNLPYEVIDNIKAHAFLDYDTAIARDVHRAYQRTVIHELSNSICRYNPMGKNISDSSSYWEFTNTLRNDELPTVILQAMNCIDCGNYIATHTTIKENTYCSCDFPTLSYL
jgi:hypothetical protein